ncbi:transcription antitermination factor NusB [Candidatus Westeberhardia cardiocondylae]|uniref:transcription antitermination factor NusB n=1 Tax=Candidatus Westeberhardia cardiocondylae TaxID=1594731 RepID=UPI003B9678BB
MKEFSVRRYTRISVIQALYAWQISKNKIVEIEMQFLMDLNHNFVDNIYFRELYLGSTTHVKELDKLILPNITRSLNMIGYVEHAILRLAIFELLYQKYVPYKVIINEAVELGKIFGTEKSYKFINSVLDKVGMQIRLNKK